MFIPATMTGKQKRSGMYALLTTLLAVQMAAAQAAPPPVVLIRAGRVFDSETGTMQPARDILVRGGTIESVGQNITAPAGAEVIDLRAYTVLPGLVDAHTHLLYLENPSSTLTMEGIKAVVTEGDALRALRGAARARTFLDAGITTVRDLGNSGLFADVALARAIREGDVAGPRIIPAGPGLSPEGGQFPGVQQRFRDVTAGEYRVIRGAEDARAAVREAVTYGARVIKIYSNNTPNPGYLSLDEMRAIVDEAKLMRVAVSAHATNDLAVWRAAEAGVNSIEHGYEISDSTLRLMARKNVALVPTDLDTMILRKYVELSGQQMNAAMLQQYLAAGRSRLKRAIDAGVTIVAGSDNYIDFKMPQGSAAKRVLFSYQQAGMPNAKVLQAATLNAGKLIGDARIGKIANGAHADIIAVSGNPLEDFNALERIVFVMAAGKVHKPLPKT
jgi:imidazolonepropionase-like amidohydrolase